MKINQIKKNKEKKSNMLLASFMLFIFPIISAFLGQYAGKLLGASIQVSQISGGITAFVLALVLIKLFDKSVVEDVEEEKIEWDGM